MSQENQKKTPKKTFKTFEIIFYSKTLLLSYLFYVFIYPFIIINLLLLLLLVLSPYYVLNFDNFLFYHKELMYT